MVLASGFANRFKNGIEQLASVGLNSELLKEYSIIDAVTVGFDKVNFGIRRDIEHQFRELIGNKIEKLTDVSYCFQNEKTLPIGFMIPDGRKSYGVQFMLCWLLPNDAQRKQHCFNEYVGICSIYYTFAE